MKGSSRAVTFEPDDTLERAIDAANLVHVLNAVCPTPETARLNDQRGGVILDPRPGRGEHNPSFSVSQEKGRWLWHRFGSEEGGNAFGLLLEMGLSKRDAAKWLIEFTQTAPSGGEAHHAPAQQRDPLQRLTEKVKRWSVVEPRFHVQAQHGPLIAARGFSAEHAEILTLHETSDRGIAFPVRDPDGRTLAVKVRLSDGGQYRYIYNPAGHGAPPWCTPEQTAAPILMVEGEFNGMAASLARPDLQVIALAGANGEWNPDWVKDRPVYVYGDADPDGVGIEARDRSARLVQLAGGSVTALEPLPWPTDFNDLLRDAGLGGLKATLDALIGSAPDPQCSQDIPSLAPIEEIHNCYYLIRKDSAVCLTNWVFQPEALLRYPDGREGTRGVIYCGQRAIPIDLPAAAWVSRRDLLAHLGPHKLVLTTNSNADVARISQHILQLEENARLPTIKGVGTYGEHDTPAGRVAVYGDGILGASGEVDQPPVFYCGPNLSADLHAIPPSSNPRDVETAIAAARASLTLINPEAALACWCKAAAANLAPRLSAHYGDRNPFLVMTGERESGKSSYAELVLRATTGRTARIVTAPNIKSDFQYDTWFSGQNDMIAMLDEYNPSQIENSWIKGHFDLTTKRRGTGNGGDSDSYHRNSPLIILGQHGIEDAAARSRSVHYFTLSSERGDPTAFYAILHSPLEALARPLRQASLGVSDETLAAWIGEAEALVRSLLAGREPRLEIALIDLAVGAKLLNHVYPAFDITAGQVHAMLRSGILNSLEGGAEGLGQRSDVELFLEQLGFAIKRVPPDSRTDYAVIPDRDQSGGSLILRSTPCVELVKAQYREKAAITSGVMLGKLCSSLAWVEVPKHGTTKSHNRNVRGVILQFAEAPCRVDLDALQDVAVALVPADSEAGHADE